MSNRITLNASRPRDDRGKRSIVLGPGELVVLLIPLMGIVVGIILPLIEQIRGWLR